MRAPVGGYTLMHGNMSQFAINPGLYSTLRYANLGVEATSSTSAQFTAYINAEVARFAKVLRETGAKVD